MTNREKYYKSKIERTKKKIEESKKKRKKAKKDIGPLSGAPQNGPASGLIGNF